MSTVVNALVSAVGNNPTLQTAVGNAVGQVSVQLASAGYNSSATAALSAMPTTGQFSAGVQTGVSASVGAFPADKQGAVITSVTNAAKGAGVPATIVTSVTQGTNNPTTQTSTPSNQGSTTTAPIVPPPIVPPTCTSSCN